MAGRNMSLGRNKSCEVRVGVMEGFLYINNLGVGGGQGIPSMAGTFRLIGLSIMKSRVYNTEWPSGSDTEQSVNCSSLNCIVNLND